MLQAGCWKVCMSLSSLLRLCVCNPGGGELWWRLPVARCHRTKPSHSTVPLLLCALPSLSLWTGHAAGPASFLCCGSGLHCAVSWLGGHHHGDGWCGVSQLPVSGIYPEPVILFCSSVHMLWTSKCLHLSEEKHSIYNTEVETSVSLSVTVCVQLSLCVLWCKSLMTCKTNCFLCLRRGPSLVLIYVFYCEMYMHMSTWSHPQVRKYILTFCMRDRSK